MSAVTQIKANRPVSAPTGAPLAPDIGISGAISRHLPSSFHSTVGSPVGTWYDSVGSYHMPVTSGTPTLRQTGGVQSVDVGTTASDIFQTVASFAPPMQFTMAIAYGWTASPTANLTIMNVGSFSIYLTSAGRISGYGGAGSVVSEPSATSVGAHRIIMTVDFTNDRASLWIDGVSRFANAVIAHPASISRQMSIRGNATSHGTVYENGHFDHIFSPTEVAIMDAQLLSSIA